MSTAPRQGNRRVAAPRASGASGVAEVAGSAPGSRELQAPVDPMGAHEPSPEPPSTSVSLPAPSKVGRGSRRGKSVPGWLRFSAGAALVLCVSGGIAWGARRYLLGSPRFSIRTVLVEGEVQRSAEQLAKAAGVVVGSNIFTLDLEQARSGVAADPWIEEVTVARSLPGTVQIKVREREPTALLAVEGELYLLSRDGEPFKKREEADPIDLPLVTGFTAQQIATDRQGVVHACRRVLEIVEDLDRSGLGRRLPLQELHVEKDDTVVATLGREALALHLGQGPFRGKLEQASRVLAELGRKKAQASVIFLDNEAHPERVVARLR